MAVKQGDNVEEGTWLITVEVTNMPSLTMRVRPTTKTSKLVKAYAERHGVDMKAVPWLNPEGQRLDLAKSAEENGLEDGDMLQGRVEQLGGAALLLPIPAFRV